MLLTLLFITPPPTPTPITPTMPHYVPPTLSLWSFTDGALQLWHTIGNYTMILQAMILLFIILYAATTIMGFVRYFTVKPEQSGGDESDLA